MKLTKDQIDSIKSRTIPYVPIHLNGLDPTSNVGSYITFYIFSKNKNPPKIKPSENVLSQINAIAKKGKHKNFNFVKIGNFRSGSKSRWKTQRGDLIKVDGNRSLAAKHCQSVLLNRSDLYLHYLMIVISDDVSEKNSLKGIHHVKADNLVRSTADRKRWKPPISVGNIYDTSSCCEQ